MKLFVVVEGCDRDWENVVGIFSTLEKAKEVGDKCFLGFEKLEWRYRLAVNEWYKRHGYDYYGNWVEIYEFELDKKPSGY